MAEALVSTNLEHLALVKHEDLRQVSDFDEEVQKLKSNFSAIQTLLEVAESTQVKEGREWFHKLQGISYDIEDVLDKWKTETMSMQFDKEVGNASNLWKKVRSFVCPHRPHLRKVLDILQNNALIKIKELNKTLEDIVQPEQTLNLRLTSVKVKPQMSVFHLPYVGERGYDENTVVEHLLDESCKEPTIPIISIVGMVTETTTLSRQVFNNDNVKSHFNKKIWVSVNGLLDKKIIIKKILKSLEGDGVTPNLDESEANLLGQIRQFFEGKKFLLVLENLENYKFLEESKLFSECDSQGSWILVTTSTTLGAEIVGTNIVILLGLGWQSSLLFGQNELPSKTSEEKLSKLASCSLLFRVLNSVTTYEERKNLIDKYQDILGKFNGLLLFDIKIIVSLLIMKDTIQKGPSVIENEIWKLGKGDKLFCPPLLLSYYDLPSNLKKCISYCTIFPKDYVIDKDKLIKLWIAQGYLEVDGKKDIELVGEEYFTILARRYFFQVFERNVFDDSITSCKMHDIVYDISHFIRENECFGSHPSCTQLELPSIEPQHVMIIKKDSLPLSDDMYNRKKLRSLIIHGSSVIDLPKLFRQLTCLRTLDMSDCPIKEISGEINKLIHLRYLNLSHNIKIEELPETVCELYNLQTLDISNCYRLQNLPQRIDKLINLRHLINHGTCLSYMPKAIEGLSCLRTLRKFVVSSDSKNEKACNFECFERLNNLEGFISITGMGNVSDVDEVNKGKLEDKEKLYGLGLRFDGWKSVDNKGIFEFQMPPNLEELVIQYYIGRTLPLERIMSLTKLRLLKLMSCFEFESLPALGKLSSLESLTICNMKNVKKVGIEFLGIESGGTSASSSINAFPKLSYLKFWGMEEWEEWVWSYPRTAYVMPCLQHLVIDSCSKLRSLHILGELKSLESLVIMRMKRVKKLDTGFFGSSTSSLLMSSFPKLKSLQFEDMIEWEDWHFKWEKQERIMPSLVSLTFQSCPKLEALPDYFLQNSTLKKLIINDCSILQQRYNKKTGISWHDISHISCIQINPEHMQGQGHGVV